MEFKKLNTRVIKEPIEEINDRTDLNVTVEYQRKDRRVVSLKFRIRRLPQLPEAHTTQVELFPSHDEMPEVVKALREAGFAIQDAWEVWQ